MNGQGTLHAGVATTVTLAALAAAIAAGLPLGLWLITRDAESTGRTLVLAGSVSGIAADLLYAASKIRLLTQAYRRQS